MPEKYLYEYAIIRVLPVVEREEFLNVGIILFSKKANYIKVLYTINENKLKVFSGDVDVQQIKMNLESLVKIANGEKNSGPIAELDVPSRFRWLTAVRSSAIQVSRPHPGMCYNLDATAERLFQELVL
ncbi:MAG: DUF3037 domain-containing protein [Chitinophagales bacterium]|jgi:hypothetical protein|nr:DUF3037 domain-containing protein [Bacteroidota bacterium]MBP8915771.1 DUF3037 domain-containing protein [Chitinophagales bacterium]MBP9220301.1 DUF3037 domain-containing protein [Chitinophagales bacterium]MBP9796584.1 DUF3037 domain-containing protein [Chitinophagales bacterium]